MTPEQIEEWRQTLKYMYVNHVDETGELCELALDGLRFRVWCDGASTTPSKLAILLARCNTPKLYREAIDKFVVEKEYVRAR